MSTGTLTVLVTDDALLESTETLTAQISNASFAAVSIGTDTATANITDNDTATANLSVTTQGDEDGPVDIVYTVTLDKVNNTGGAITFDLDDLGTGTATAGDDYTAIAANAQVSIADGMSTGTLTVLVTDDALLESTETLIAQLSNSSFAAVSIGTDTATANITDNDTATANLSVTTQGDEDGPVDIVYTVTLDKVNNTGGAITFDLDDLGTGSATAGDDYTAIAANAQVSIADGMSTGTLTVLVTDDALLESTETLTAQISNASFAAVSIGTDTATANITDNDTATANLSMTTQGDEDGPVDIVFTVTLDKVNNTGGAITFDLDDLGTGTATSGDDYTAIAANAQVSIADGASTGTLTVLVTDDALLESTETLIAQISNSSFASVSIGTDTATANIADDDTAMANLSVTTQGGEDGPVDIVYTVTLDKVNNTGSAITFDLDDLGIGTATAGDDYTAIAANAQVSIADGMSTGTLTVLVTDDTLLESTETIDAQISNASFAAVSIGTDSATANIADNDTATANLSVTTQGDEDGPVDIVYTVTLDKVNNTGSAITFDLDDLGTGTATAGDDYTAIAANAQITVADGVSTGTLTVLVTDDALLESTETLVAQISNSSFAAVSIGTDTATANITDNDTATANLSVTTQGDEDGPVDIVFTVTLDKVNNTGGAITFDLDDLGTGTATAVDDYTAIAANAQVSIADGMSTGTLTVLVTDDALLESTETLIAQLSNSSFAAVSIGTDTATANIADNDTAVANLSVTTQGDEDGPVNIVYTVTLDKVNNTGGAITFDLDDLGTGTATAGDDYTAIAANAQITVADGMSTGTLTVLVTDDALLESTETLIAQISNPSFAAVSIGTDTATANIADNDTATANLSVTTQGDEDGPVDIVYTVTLDKVNNTGGAITFDLDDLGTGTATAGDDYTAIAANAQITVADGMSTGTLTVLVTDDTLLESTETLIAQISNSSFASVSIGTDTATANIADNDTAVANLSVTTQGDEDGPVNIVYTVTLDKVNNTGSAITFDLDDLGTGTATAGDDYTAIAANAQITVADGMSTGTLTVLVTDDTLLESTETLIAQISNASFAAVSIGTDTATANIADNDTAVANLAVTTQGNEDGPVDIVFTVTLDKVNNTGGAITFDLDDLGTGSATSGDDYTAIAANAQISIADGSDTGTLAVLVTDDALLESTETVDAQISDSSFAAVSIGTDTATANIADNDTATANLSVTTQGDEDGPVDIVFTVTLDKVNNTGGAVTFDLDDLGTGSATSGDDYTAIAANAQVSIADGASTGTLTVLVTDDTLLESTETVVAQISNPSFAAVSIGTDTATANITDNDTATANLSVTTQGDEDGPVDIVFTVTLDKVNNTGGAITFDLDDLGTGTAIAGDDYTAIAANAQITVADGMSTGTLTVLVTDDALLESTETIDAQISNPSFAAVSIGTDTATANVADNDTAVANLAVTTQGDEDGPVDIVYTVTLDKVNNTGGAITFDLDDLGTGSATAGDDYTAIAANAQITVADGMSTGTLTVLVTDDALLESTETLTAQISNPSFAAVSIGTDTATANITDNDTATANLSVTTQGDEDGPVDIVYTVTLDKVNNTGSAITFDLDDLSTGTATSGDDYTAIAANAQISIADGASTGTLTVLVTDDALLESTETLVAQISNASFAAVSIGTDTATATIADNDTATANLSVTTQGDEDGPVDIVYTVTLDKVNNTGSAITFDLDDLGTGTATAGDDYTAIAANAQVSIADGASTGMLTVLVTDDALLESTETLIAQISNPSFASVSIGTDTATANIADNDTAVANLSVTTQGDEDGPVDIVYIVTLDKVNNTGSAITFDLDDLGTGSATAGDDYTAITASAQITVADGMSTGTLTVLVTDDALLESTETLVAQISNPSFAAVSIGTDTATANIADNDTATANLSVTTQGDEDGPVDIVYTVTLDKVNNTGGAITFDLDDLGTGSATAGDDYTAIAANAQITVADGMSTGTLTVLVTDDALLESTETLVAQLSNSSFAAVSIGTDTATANIADDDTAVANLSVTTQGDEDGPVDIVYTVTLDKVNNTGSAITFDLDDLGTGTATAGDDYTAIAANAQISIADGSDTGTLTVLVTDDALLESTETVVAQISNSSFAAVSIGTDTATADIADNDTATANLSVTTQGDEDGPVDIVYTVTLDKVNNTGGAITFDLDDLLTGTATSGDDYTAIAANAQVSIADGASTGTLTVLVTDDTLLESTETLIAQISNASFAAVSIGTDTATANITDNDTATANLSVTTQGDEGGPVDIVFTVTLDKMNNTGGAITFDLDDLGTGTATAGDDYTAIAANAQITVADGMSTGTLTVLVTDDALLESSETLIAQISNSSFAAVSIGTDTATANIADNDTAVANLSVTTQGDEDGPVDIVYTVTLDKVNNTGGAITFDLDDLGIGTATAGDDYTAIAANAQITVADGMSTGTLTVLVTDDALLESTETLIAQISNASFAAVSIGTDTATANIADNDTATANLSVTTQGDEDGPVDIVFTVTLDKVNNTGSAITFDLDDLGTGSATSGDDYTAIAANAQVSIADGMSTGTLTVLVTDDTLLESTETVDVQISNPSFATVSIGTDTATASIADNDTAVANLSVTTQGDEDGPVDIVYTVTLDKVNNTGSAITFDLDDLGTGSATAGDDYTAIAANAQVSIADGMSTGTLTVLVTDDTLLESTETVDAQVSNSSFAAVSIGTDTATANIADNDTAVANLSVTTQGDEDGPVNIVYTVTLDKANNTGDAITFDLDDLGTGSATAGDDYTAIAANAQITVADGMSTGTLTVLVTDDTLLESTETVDAQLSNASFAAVSIGTDTATANITDNDTATANLSVTTQGDEDGPVDIVYTVTLDKVNNTGSAITFDFADLGTGTATAGDDYTAIAANAQISIADGMSTGTLTVLVTDDALLESTETVVAQLSNSSFAAVSIGTNTATANIADNDTVVANLSVTTQGDEDGPVDIVYTVTLDRVNNTGSAITFDLADLGTGTATAGDDYTALLGTEQISIAAGSSIGTFAVTVIDDALLESTETQFAQISNSSFASVSIGTDTATANITDNDTATANLSVTTQGDEDGPVDIVYTVTLDKVNNTGGAITFDLDDLGTGTATAGDDYTAIAANAQVSIADGMSTGTLTVLVTDDALLESTETLVAQISNSSFAAVSIGTDTATANITDNDTATANLSVTTQGDEDGPVDIVFTVTLDKVNNTGGAITFDLDDLGTGTATAGDDYTAIAANAQVSIADGASTGTLTVLVTDDALLESTETLVAQISNPSFAAVSIGTDTATANIADNDTATANLSVTTQGDEDGPVEIVFTVTLDKVNNTGSAITFDLDDLGTGSATSGDDYTAIAANAQITVADGMSTGTLTVLVTDDALLESTETVDAQISNSSFAAVSIGTDTATANIADNDTAVANLSVTTHGDEDGPVDIVFTVTLDKVNNTGSAITFDLDDLLTGTATSGDDYTTIAANAQVSIADGASTGMLTVLVTDDALLESTETLIAQISNPSFASVSIGTDTATANIADNDTAVANLSVTTQGDEDGPVDIVYIVTLDKVNNTGSAITFDLDDLGTGSATAGDDYTAITASAQITVADGMSTGTLTVLVTDDALLESTETLVAQISNPSFAAVSIGTDTATANIADNDTATANLSVTTQGDEDGPVDIVYTVTLDKVNNTGGAITFDLDDLGTGSATAGDDYAAIAANAQITVADGMSTGTLTVLVTDDALLESTETLVAQLSNSSFAAVSIGTDTATANIADDDTAVANLSVTTQGDEDGPVDIVYTVTLDKVNNTGSAITFDLDDLGTGTATAGDDYTAIAANAQVSIADGMSTGTLTVLVTDDALLESTETLVAQTSNASFAAVSIGTDTATANIADDDTAVANLSVTTQGDEDGPVDIVYTVTLDKVNNTGSAITFDLDDLGTGTATAGDDYTAIAANAQVSIADGMSTGTLTVLVTDDALLESTETLVAQISNSSFAAVSIGTDTATANITDNDTATANLSVTTQGDEDGPVDIVFTVTLDKVNNTGGAITFDLDDLGTGTATAGDDYTAIAANAQVSIADGSDTGALTVLVTDDALLESTETLTAQISNVSFATVSIGTDTATANIADNDTATANLSVTTQGDEDGPVDIVFAVTLDKVNNTGSAITFDLDDLGTGTATSGDDYTAIAANAQITVADGMSTGTLTVLVTDDTLLESTETLIAQLSNSSFAAVSIGTDTATASIADNDTATANLSVTTQGDEDGPVDIVYTVTLDKVNNTGSAITFDFTDLGTGTATAGDDYTALLGTEQITVAAGSSTGTFTVTVIDDALLESTETLIAQISNPGFAAVSIGTDTATADIADNDTATANLSVTTQGDEDGPVDIVYTVTLDKVNNTGSAITFDLDDLGTGTATAGDDYTAIAANAQVSIADGSDTGTLTVLVTDDALLESTETLTAQISNPSFAAVSIGTDTATANVADNDTATANLSVTTQGDEDGPVDIVFAVTLDKVNNTGSAITFDLDDLGTGTATAGDDYTAIAANAQITVADGMSTGTLTVLVTDDALLESTETIDAQISNVSFAAVSIGTDTATASITDNDTATANLSVTTQGDEDGPVDIVYTVTLDKVNNTGGAITFDLDDLGTGTATAGDDYTAIAANAQITVADGMSTGTLTVLVTDDALLESTETLTAQLSSSSFAAVSIGTDTATANIADNDTATANLSVTTQGDEDGPVNIVYTVTLDKVNNTGSAITFDFADLAGTATAGDDYTAIAANAQISIADGMSAGTFTVLVTDDALLESTETVAAQLSNSSFASVAVGVDTATADIIDNDTATATISVTQNGAEPGGPGNTIIYTVALDKVNNTGADITFNLIDTLTGTAIPGDAGPPPTPPDADYAQIPGGTQITIANGASSATFELEVFDDPLLELTETVVLEITPASVPPSVTITEPTATAELFDDDGADLTAALSVSEHGDENGPQAIELTVTLSASNATGIPITFDLADLGTGSASAGLAGSPIADYLQLPAGTTISVPDGSATGSLLVPVFDDLLLEATETVDFRISAPSNPFANIAEPDATATIADNDTATASLSVTTQGDEAGPVDFVFTVTLSRANNSGADIIFQINDVTMANSGTATAGADYAAFDGQFLTVADGATTGSLTVSVIDDALLEAAETVFAQIGSPVPDLDGRLALATDTAIVTITDNNTAVADLSVTTQGDETGPVSIVYTVTLSTTNNTGTDISFAFDDLGTGTATSGDDYTAVPADARISVADGATAGTFTVVVLDDALLEATEVVVAQISDSSNPAVTIGTPSVIANIVDDDTAIATVMTRTQGNEEGPVAVEYVVTLSKVNRTGQPIVFDVSDLGTGSATAGEDYHVIPANTRIAIADGAQSATFTVDVIDDDIVEPTETVNVRFRNPSHSGVSLATGTSPGNAGSSAGVASAMVFDNDELPPKPAAPDGGQIGSPEQILAADSIPGPVSPYQPGEIESRLEPIALPPLAPIGQIDLVQLPLLRAELRPEYIGSTEFNLTESESFNAASQGETAAIRVDAHSNDGTLFVELRATGTDGVLIPGTRYQVSLPDGTPLPDWLSANTVGNHLSGRPPVGMDSIAIRVEVTLPDGSKFVRYIEINLADNAVVPLSAEARNANLGVVPFTAQIASAASHSPASTGDLLRALGL